MSENELRKLVSKRGQIKARVTRFRVYLDDAEQIKSDAQLSSRLSRLRDCWSEFETVQSEIESIEQECKLSEEGTNERETFEENYFDVESRFEELLHASSPTNVSSHGRSSDELNSTITKNVSIQLPILNLPTFTGAYEEWLPFHDTFQSLINANSSLTPIQKFHYLRSSLKGEPSQLIQSLEISAINYDVAWALLKNRYENKRIIVGKHIQALFNLSHVERESVSALRRLLDDSLKHIRALQTLGQPTDQWDCMLIYLVTQRLDQGTRRAWETHSPSDELPSFAEFVSFLQQRCRVLDACEANSSTSPNSGAAAPHKTRTTFRNPKDSRSKYAHKHKQEAFSYITTLGGNCPLCKDRHRIYQCEVFTALSVPERVNKVKELKYCMNCLRPGHITIQCKSSSCKMCNKRHNTMLHLIGNSSPVGQQVDSSQEPAESALNSCLHNTNDLQQVMLATAVVLISDSRGELFPCRVLLESGSQSNFITSSLAQSLGLPQTKTRTPILGINQEIINTSHIVRAEIRSRFNAFNAKLNFIILPKITGELPQIDISKSSFKVPPGIQLADPQYGRRRKIDALIGAEIFWELLCTRQIKTSSKLPVLQKTTLGWVISGTIPAFTRGTSSQRTLSCNVSTIPDLTQMVANFWQIEEVRSESNSILTEEEQDCERHFVSHLQRDSGGRFIVKLPFRHDPVMLGHTRDNAKHRFKKLEVQLSKQPKLGEEYRNFMNEYLELDHMECVAEGSPEGSTSHFYLPHHPVIKADSSTTKVRVVFDGSAKSSTGTSLNDLLMVGPTTQRDLFSILLSFRFHKFVFTADIKQMYRQIRLDAPDTDFQRILWRSSPREQVKTYRLTTVTYGLSSSAFLATRCLLQLARTDGQAFTFARRCLEEDFYVDDILTGADTIESARLIQEQLITLLSQGGFQLRKWCANHPSLLDSIKPEHQELSYVPHTGFQPTIKTLGLRWEPSADQFKFNASQTEGYHRISRRFILSEISRLFDPLGLITPVLVRAKIIMQDIWQLKGTWDESVPAEINTRWREFKSQLRDLNLIRPQRRVTLSHNGEMELHGFSDASEAAYGACLYIRSFNDEGKACCRLLCAKSRVAPLKKITLPRLELCGALLLSRLVRKLVNLGISFKERYLWTDSSIVLAWLSASPGSWNTFVANRVSEIQQATENMIWRHVPSTDNPADILSRGASPSQLYASNIWWSGPAWLQKNELHWPKIYIAENLSIGAERRKNPTFSLVALESKFDLFEKFSSFSKLKRVTAYCLRFIKNLRSSRENRLTGRLQLKEIRYAELCLVKLSQSQCFDSDLKARQSLGSLPNSSKLKALNPFLDDNGVIRVGGRLINSAISADQKHPILLPANHKLTELIIYYFHVTSLHSGPLALLASIRLTYWPIHGRKLVTRAVRKCVTCFKVKPKLSNQLMGDLPSTRITPNRAFLNTGVDFFGPLSCRRGLQRRDIIIKVYVALFVCFSTKAVHLELVMDLTTSSFLAALRRFMSRRGKCANIYSDNATTFVGANRELRELKRLFASQTNQDEFSHALAEDNITWHFNPPRSPNFGGLWEAAVKSIKFHLRRVVGKAILTPEELGTVLAQIEACVNSRPLTPLSNDPNDLNPLTPGHFLIGQPLTAVPEPDLTSLASNRLSRWQHVQLIARNFWKRWSAEYLTTLQQRTRWTARNRSLQEGMLVVLQEDLRPPLFWETGRITELHPGRDGLCRVATIKTPRGSFKRPITKLGVLPIY